MSLVGHSPLSGPQYRHRAIRSYSRRSGKITVGQKRAIELSWPQYGLDLHEGQKGFSAAFGRAGDLVLEIGFGNGLSLAQQAEHEPEKNFLGVEVHSPGIGRLIRNLNDREINNVRLYHADALDVLALCVPAASVDRLQLYFPDPWPKKKYLKRRLVQTHTIPHFLRVLKPLGFWHIATDCSGYAEAMQAALMAHDGCKVTVSLNNSSGLADLRPETKFERNGRALGHTIYDLEVQIKS